MENSKGNDFTIKLLLEPTTVQERMLDALFDNANQIFNAVEDEGEKRVRRLRNLGERRMLVARMEELGKRSRKQKKAITGEKVNEEEKDAAASEYVATQKELHMVKERLAEIKKQNGYAQYSLQAYAHQVAANLDAKLPYDVVTNVSDDAWRALQKYFKGETRKLRRRPTKGQSMLWSKRTDSPFKLIDSSHLRIAGQLVPISSPQKRKPDDWMRQAMGKRTKRIGVKREVVCDRKRYFALIDKEGHPPGRAAGEFLAGRDGKVLLDPGPSTLFEMSRDLNGQMEFRCYELCRGIDFREVEVDALRRKMSRSLRQANPQCYDADGAVVKGARFTNISKRYKEMKSELSALLGGVALERDISHDRLANLILSHGSHIIVDRTRWQALARRKKETSCRKSDGRAMPNKRFGDSIGKRAPGALLSKVEERAGWCGGSYEEILSELAKTSQYDHIYNIWTKIALDVRWKKIGGKYWVQRDCYALFYMDHLVPVYTTGKDGAVKVVGYEVDVQGMVDEFEDFLEAQACFMEWVDAHGTDKIKAVTRRPKELLAELGE